MRSVPFMITLVIWAALGLSPRAAAQEVAPPTIHRVTLEESTGTIRITGTGLGPALVVTVEGQPAAVQPGATATQMEVLAPASVLTTTGTYRLTVADPVSQFGDVFIVARLAATVAPEGVDGTVTSAQAAGAAHAPGGQPVVGQLATTAPKLSAGPGPLTVIEDSGYPWRTALGYQALFSNTTGAANTASGYQALSSNTTGTGNTASGYQALFANTGGDTNTATGYQALYSNRTGSYNTGIGLYALFRNIYGDYNTAVGTLALQANQTGAYNTACGHYSLASNTTGSSNTACGMLALSSNTTGSNNTATGYGVLVGNTTGEFNSASGRNALFSNITGSDNTANGTLTLFNNTAGAGNTADGREALYNNSTGNFNTALGYRAGYGATTGSYNLSLGAEVTSTLDDTNTIRIGLPYDNASGKGQNQTFIAGIYGTALTDGLPVVINANGQLGTISPQSGGAIPAPLSMDGTVVQLQRQVVDLSARLARLESLLRNAAAVGGR